MLICEAALTRVWPQVRTNPCSFHMKLSNRLDSPGIKFNSANIFCARLRCLPSNSSPRTQTTSTLLTRSLIRSMAGCFTQGASGSEGRVSAADISSQTLSSTDWRSRLPLWLLAGEPYHRQSRWCLCHRLAYRADHLSWNHRSIASSSLPRRWDLCTAANLPYNSKTANESESQRTEGRDRWGERQRREETGEGERQAGERHGREIQRDKEGETKRKETKGERQRRVETGGGERQGRGETRRGEGWGGERRRRGWESSGNQIESFLLNSHQ